MDEDASYQRTLGSALARLGGEVLWCPATDGLHDSLRDYDPDVLVLGRELSDVDPLSLLRDLRRSRRWMRLPLYLVCEGPDTEFELQAYAAGADAVLERRQSMGELAARVLGEARRATRPDARRGSRTDVPDVIVIEDEEVLVEMLEYALRNRGYRMAAYTSADEALEALRSFEPGRRQPVVLLNVDLPEFDGFQVLREIERTRPGLFRILLCTVHGSEAAQVVALRNGALDYLVKPLRMPVVLAKVERLLETRPAG